MTDKRIKEIIIELARKFAWVEITEMVMEEMYENCPNTEECAERAIENHEPQQNEAYQ